VSIDASPPAQPPQMSPDGNWVWDGSQWQPVTAVEPGHQGVFAAYAHKVEAAEQVIAASPPSAVAAPAQVAPPAVEYQYPAPAADYYPPAESVVPMWQQPKSSGKTIYLYAGGAVVLFLMVLIVLNTINFLSLPFIGGRTSSNSPVATSPSPSASPVTRSEYGRADAFLNGSIYNSLVALAQVDTGMPTCNGEFTNACFDAITVTDPPMKSILSVIAQASIPACIAVPMKQFKDDLAYMEGGLQSSLKAYKDGNHNELIDGLSRWVVFYNRIGPDFQGTNAILHARCNTDKLGP
jgi:hypothetical protein